MAEASYKSVLLLAAGVEQSRLWMVCVDGAAMFTDLLFFMDLHFSDTLCCVAHDFLH